MHPLRVYRDRRASGKPAKHVHSASRPCRRHGLTDSFSGANAHEDHIRARTAGKVVRPRCGTGLPGIDRLRSAPLGLRPPKFIRLAHEQPGRPRGLARLQHHHAHGPGADYQHGVAHMHARVGDRVQTASQRFCQRRHSEIQPVGHPERSLSQNPGRHSHILREPAVNPVLMPA